MQRDAQQPSAAQFAEDEVDEFALRLQCAEEMEVCGEETGPDRVDQATGRDFGHESLADFQDTPHLFDPYYFTTKQSHLTPPMRATLLDWLQHTCSDFTFHRNTYYLAVLAIDRYLSVISNVSREDYQLVGITALYIASKIEEVIARKIVDFAKIADNAYTLDAIRGMERRILVTLRWKMGTACSPFSALSYATWQWDVFLSSKSNSAPLLFHSPNPPSYNRYSELLQVLDLAYMDISALLFPYKHVALGLLYIGVVRSFHESDLEDMSLDDLQRLNSQAESLFSEFLASINVVSSMRELFPVLDFLYPFLDLRFETQPIPEGLVLQLYEDFVGCQTYNPHSLQFIRRKMRLQG